MSNEAIKGLEELGVQGHVNGAESNQGVESGQDVKKDEAPSSSWRSNLQEVAEMLTVAPATEVDPVFKKALGAVPGEIEKILESSMAKLEKLAEQAKAETSVIPRALRLGVIKDFEQGKESVEALGGFFDNLNGCESYSCEPEELKAGGVKLTLRPEASESFGLLHEHEITKVELIFKTGSKVQEAENKNDITPMQLNVRFSGVGVEEEDQLAQEISSVRFDLHNSRGGKNRGKKVELDARLGNSHSGEIKHLPVKSLNKGDHKDNLRALQSVVLLNFVKKFVATEDIDENGKEKINLVEAIKPFGDGRQEQIKHILAIRKSVMNAKEYLKQNKEIYGEQTKN